MSDPRLVPGTMKMTVELEVQHWNAVIIFLSKQPYENVFQLIDMIREQLARQQSSGAARGEAPSSLSVHTHGPLGPNGPA